MYKSILSAVCVTIVYASTLLVLTPAVGLAEGGMFSIAPAPPIFSQLPPTWSQKLPANQRFEVVLGGEGVLDKETGLVWQRYPWNSQWTWDGARAQCNSSEIGGRMGWHLPTVEQLTSLVDRSSTSGKMVPEGHPFGTVWGRYPYWTASTYPGAPDFAFQVNFVTGELYGGYKLDGDPHIWCVRGGQSYEAF